MFSARPRRHRVPSMATRTTAPRTAPTRRSWAPSRPASPAPALLATALGREPREHDAARPRRALGAATFKAARTISRDEVASFIREPFVEGEAHEGGEEPVETGDLRQAIGELVTCSPLRRHLGRGRPHDDADPRAALRPPADLVARRRGRERLPPGRLRRAHEQEQRARAAARAVPRRPADRGVLRIVSHSRAGVPVLRLCADATLAVLDVWRSSPAGGASAYSWPFKPFNKQHPIRGFFGDPRTVYENGVLAGGFDGPGFFSFHQGDRHRRARRHADLSGRERDRALPRRGDAERRRRPNRAARIFQYFHIVPIVGEGQQVIAKKTILGYVQPPFGHVHLTEINGTHVGQPAAAGTPDAVRRPHEADDPRRRCSATRPATLQTPLGLCGRVELAVDAFDTPPVPGARASSTGCRSRPRSCAGHHAAERHRRRPVAHRRRLPHDAAGERALLRRLREGHVRERAALRQRSSTRRCPAATSSCSPATSTRRRSRTASTR